MTLGQSPASLNHSILKREHSLTQLLAFPLGSGGKTLTVTVRNCQDVPLPAKETVKHRLKCGHGKVGTSEHVVSGSSSSLFVLVEHRVA